MGKNRNGRRKKAQQSNTPSTDGEDQAQDGSLLIDIDPPLPPPQLSSKLLAAHADPVHDLEEEFYASGNDYSDELWTGEEQKERGVDDELLSDSAHIREPIFTQPLEHPAQGPEPAFEHERATFDNRTGSGRTDDDIANPSQDVVRFSNGSENTDEDTRVARAAANVSKGRTGTAGGQPESVLSGHTRAPMISRNPTRLENLSKTVTNYVPSSIAISIPSAALSPPRVSRPVSFGRFMTSSDQDDRSIPADQHRKSWGPEAGFKTLDEVLALDEPDTTTASINMRYPKPGVEGTERITWARWDALPDSEGSRPRLILLLGYMSGMQIWDCTNLDALKELLNFPDVPWGRIWQAAVLPPRLDDGELDSVRPLLGIISKQASRDPEFLVYSIRSHTILKRISVPGLVSFAASSRFIILSCANPSALNILSASTFTILHIIPSSSLALFGRRRPQSPTHPPNERRDDTHEPEEVIDPEALPSEYDMRPVFALSGRLLAATSPPPREDYPATTRTNSGYLGMDPANLPGADVVAGLTQSDLGTAARRVGSSMLSGVRALGGLAISAARTHLSGDSSSPISAAVRPRPVATSPSPTPPLRPFASRSAPSPTGLRLGATADNVQPLLTDLNPTSSDRATYVTVYDLMPLLDGDQSLEPFSHTIQSQPQTHSLSRQASHSSTMILNPVTSFPSPRNIRVSALQFSSDGTRVLVVPEDGHTLREYAIRPPLCVNGRYTSEESDDDVARAKGNHSWHVYDLRRGRTTAVVDSVEPSADGRWIALGSRKRTVHVFATNPYGGPSDERSHMAGRVFNASALQPLSTTLTPIIRLRAPHVDPGGLSPPPLAVTFISAPLNSLPRRLLPPANVHSPPSSTTGSAASSPSPEPRSPIARKRPTNYQDVLIFDSLDGTLSLRRFFLEQRQTELGLAVPNGIPGIGGTSISLPSRPSFGLSSSSPSSGRVSALSAMMEKPAELHARESEIATWNLRRSREWDVFRGQVHNAPISKAIEQKGKTNWLWQAELQTSSLSRQILPRSIYLVYQFAFFTLDEDYQGVIRRQRLDVAGSRTPVRREVPVSAHAVGDGDAPFTQRAGRASFDEGLSSAISSSLDVGAGSPPVIPTYPNGGTSGSYKSSMPISRVTEGMSEGLARMRREIGRVRSPRILPRVDKDAPASAGVPLEFDEADEHFALEGGMSSPSASQEASDDCDRLLGHFSQDNRLQGAQAAQHTNLPLNNEQEASGARYAGSSGATGGSEVARAGGTTLGDHDSEIWPSWEHAVGETEPFDEISAVGFMDEEQEAQQETERELARATTGESGKKKRRRRGKSPMA